MYTVLLFCREVTSIDGEASRLAGEKSEFTRTDPDFWRHSLPVDRRYSSDLLTFCFPGSTL